VGWTVDVSALPLQPAVRPLDPDAADLPRLRAVLEGHGFLGDAVERAVGARIGPAHLRKDLPLYLRRLEAKTPLNTLVKLLSIGQWVAEQEAASAVAPVPVDRLVAAGLLERSPRGVHGLVELVVHRDLLLAHDRFDPARGPNLAPDHVLGTNAPALLLDSLTVRRPVRETLDIGCGGGVQSFLAARHSQRVVAVDKNPRALNFLRLNARLNGVANLDTLEGDLFAPVEGRRFGLVVCNPPYVISPDTRCVFMDSGRPLDSICEEVVRRAAEHLEEGGFASVLCNWALRGGEDWAEPLRRWVSGSGCDAWLLRGDHQDPLSYAALWNRGREPQEYGEAIDRWRAYYREAGIESIAMGGVILRRRAAGTNWVRADVLPGEPAEPCHEQILRVFAAEDLLAELPDDEALLARAFRLVDTHRLSQDLRLREGRFVIEEAEIRLEGGLRFRGTVDSATLQLLQRCDGRTPAGVVVDELSRGEGADRGRVRAAVASTIRKLMALGFLVPSVDGPNPPVRPSQ
jgi:SAM-dependent methyltransferase